MINADEYRQIRNLSDVLTMRKIAESMATTDKRRLELVKNLTEWMNELFTETDLLVNDDD